MKAKLEGYRTRIYAVLVALIGIAVALGFVDPGQQEGALFSANEVMGALIVAISGGIAFFRQITTGPVASG